MRQYSNIELENYLDDLIEHYLDEYSEQEDYERGVYDGLCYSLGNTDGMINFVCKQAPCTIYDDKPTDVKLMAAINVMEGPEMLNRFQNADIDDFHFEEDISWLLNDIPEDSILRTYPNSAEVKNCVFNFKREEFPDKVFSSKEEVLECFKEACKEKFIDDPSVPYDWIEDELLELREQIISDIEVMNQVKGQ